MQIAPELLLSSSSHCYLLSRLLKQSPGWSCSFYFCPVSSMLNRAAQMIRLMVNQMVSLPSTKPLDDFSYYFEEKSKSFTPYSPAHSISVSVTFLSACLTFFTSQLQPQWPCCYSSNMAVTLRPLHRSCRSDVTLQTYLL